MRAISTATPMMWADGAHPLPTTRRLSRGHYLWVCALILSFAYEIPIWSPTPYYRVNPRLYDVVVVIGIVFFAPRLLRQRIEQPLLRIWAGIVLVFVCCALIWTVVWIPWYCGKYSMFYAVTYALGLLTVRLAVGLPIRPAQKKMFHNLVIIGGIIVAAYALWERSQGGAHIRQLAEGNEYVIKEGKLVSCLGVTYFHLAMYSTLASVMALARALNQRRPYKSVLFLGLALFTGWPAFFSGARTGVVAIVVAWLSLLWLSAGAKRLRLGLLLLTMAGAIALTRFTEDTESLFGLSPSLERFREMEDKGANTIVSRLTLRDYSLDLYQWQGWRIPFIGAGFYVAPHTYGGQLNYRIGYGIHHSILFPLEQGGLAAFVLYILFLHCSFKRLYAVAHAKMEQDSTFAQGVLAYWIAVFVLSWGGQVFWLGTGTAHMNTYTVLLLALATCPCTILRPKIPSDGSSQRRYNRTARRIGLVTSMRQ